MSVHVSSAIWKIAMPNSGRKLVAIALADMADDDGRCWPSIRSVAIRCNMSPGTVAEHLAALKASGILNAAPRFDGRRQTSNVYSFAMPPRLKREGGEKGEGGEKHRGEGGDFHGGGGGLKTPPHEPSVRSAIEPPKGARPISPSKTPPFPDDLPAEYREQLTLWWKHKVESKKPYQTTGWEVLVKRERKKPIHELTRDIEHSIGNNYQGIFPPSGNGTTTTATNGTHTKRPLPGQFL